MAISLVGTGFNAQSTSANSHTLTQPGSILDGDYGLLAVEYAGTNVPSTPVSNGQSWTKLGTTQGPSTSVQLAVYGKSMLASDSSQTINYTFSAVTRSVKTVSVFRGVLAVDVVVGSNGGTTAQATVSLPSVTPNSDDDWLIGNAGMRYGTATGGIGTVPSGTVILVEANDPTAGIHYGAFQTRRSVIGGAGVAQPYTDILMQNNMTYGCMVVALSPVPSTKYRGWGQPIAALPA